MATGEVRTLLFSDGVNVATPTPVPTAKTITDSSGWTGSVTTITYDVSSLGLPDATAALWFFMNSAKKQIGADVTPTDTTHVQVSVDEKLPAGTYYLMGVY